MQEYLVCWHINIQADSPQEAAEKALEIQRDPTSLATVFEVSLFGVKEEPVLVDLSPDPRLFAADKED